MSGLRSLLNEEPPAQGIDELIDCSYNCLSQLFQSSRTLSPAILSCYCKLIGLLFLILQQNTPSPALGLKRVFILHTFELGLESNYCRSFVTAFHSSWKRFFLAHLPPNFVGRGIPQVVCKNVMTLHHRWGLTLCNLWHSRNTILGFLSRTWLYPASSVPLEMLFGPCLCPYPSISNALKFCEQAVHSVTVSGYSQASLNVTAFTQVSASWIFFLVPNLWNFFSKFTQKTSSCVPKKPTGKHWQ